MKTSLSSSFLQSNFFNSSITCNSTKSNDVKEIEKAIEKLKIQEKKLVDLYLSSTIDVETIYHSSVKFIYLISML